jgi:alpha-amylase
MTYSRFNLTILLLLFLTFTFLQAQTTDIAFQVNMNYMINQSLFDPTSETVDIAGDFNDWGETPFQLNDADEDGIYAGSTALNIGTTISFKARLNGVWDGREEFSGGGPNRTYTVEENGVVEFWYNDDVPDDVLDVQIAVSNSVAKPGESVQFFDMSSGEPVSWNWTFTGGTPSTSTEQNPVVSYSTEGSYSVSLKVKNSEDDSASKTFTDYMRIDNMLTQWWNDAVWYEVFVRSFKDSDGDGIGDLQGLINKLDYLNDGDPETHSDLGITGIWLMPLQQSPSYHGYDVTDYRSVNSDYGTNQKFKDFIDAAHERGIKVIVDYVMNHTSDQHTWFTQSNNNTGGYRDWYRWEDTNPGGTGPWDQTVWHQRNGDYYYGIFWGGMPDLNYTHEAVKTEMFDIASFWLEDMNADGFRLDAVKYIIEEGEKLEDTESTFQFWRDFRTHYKSVDNEAFAVGEAWTSTEKVKEYVNSDGLDYCFDFDLATAIINATNNGNVSGLQNQVELVMSSYPFLQFGSFLTNHDQDRIMSELAGNTHKAKLAASLLLTFPGIPYIYYGEEIGMTGTGAHENIRTPLHWNNTANAGFTSGTPWRSVNTDYTSKNIAAQQADDNSLWSHYRNLIDIRNNQPALRKGNYKLVNASDDAVYSFLRQLEDEHVMVVANLNGSASENIQLSLPYAGINPGIYQLTELQGGDPLSIDIDTNGGFTDVTIPSIPARTTYIYKIEESNSVFSYEPGKSTISIYPVPATNEINIAISANYKGIVTYSILDISGRVYRNDKFEINSFGESSSINLESLPKGFYVIHLVGKDLNESKRFIKK